MNMHRKWALSLGMAGAMAVGALGCTTGAKAANASANRTSPAYALVLAPDKATLYTLDAPAHRFGGIASKRTAITGTGPEALLPPDVAAELKKEFPTKVIAQAPQEVTPNVAGSVIGYDFNPGPYRPFLPLQR